MTKVTVAMAAYNHEKYVGQAIQSVLSQEGCDFDFIIVDDGSSDGTVREILKFKDPRIHFIPFEKNQGACVALNKAIEGGKGEYVAILNSDDCFLPGKLEMQVKFLDEHPDVYAVFAYPQIVDENGTVIKDKNHFCGDVFRQPNRTRHEWLKNFFYKQNALCHPSALLRRSCYTELGYYDPRLAQLPDFDFWIRLLLKHEIYILPEELIQFRILSNEGNASAPRTESYNRTIWELSQVLKQYLKIATIEEYLLIFPEESPSLSRPHSDFIPFYLANLALRVDSSTKSAYRFFGLDVLYSILGNPELQDRLERTLGYRYADFIKSTGIPLFVTVPANLISMYYRLSKYPPIKWIMRKLLR